MVKALILKLINLYEQRAGPCTGPFDARPFRLTFHPRMIHNPSGTKSLSGRPLFAARIIREKFRMPGQLLFRKELALTSLIAEVAVAAPLDKTLSYVVPEALREQARIGMRLRVPLGRRSSVAYLLELREGDPEGLKEIREVLDREPLFPPHLVPFYRRSAEYYRHPIGEVIRTALPSGLSGAVERVRIATERIFSATEHPGEPAGSAQRRILGFLRENGPTPTGELNRFFSAPHAPLKRLKELGFVSEKEVERRRDPFFDIPVPPDSGHSLTGAQKETLKIIDQATHSGGFASFLLHGVTGSGKTEVYLRAIQSVLAQGRKALVLVPEIALTPQLVGRFRARFSIEGIGIAVLHSGLSDGERYDAWREIARGGVEIVIGARSAVFAPLSDVGMIVVDEEHEGTYKQGEGFRYNARDLALMRGQMENAAVLLGSATPSLTTYHRAMEGPVRYLSLPGRILDRNLPETVLVDMTGNAAVGALSEDLRNALEANLKEGGQSLLLLNRRGFAPFLLCADCGETFRCPNCEITLTYYQSRRRLLCHYCDYLLSPPDLCPRCRGGNILPEGVGTERLEEELATAFPAARIVRMDRDTTSRKGSHQRMTEAMEKREIDILVGTQMIAKGHDFPGVTLVGVVNADAALNLPDFRSAERGFSLLTQVAGRAGRGDRPGKVLIQTYNPEHYAIACAARHDFQGFFGQEIEFRRELSYPPFGFLVNLVFSGNEAEKTAKEAEETAEALRRCTGDVEILGPAPCPLSRIRGKSRVQVLLKATSRAPLHRLLSRLGEIRKRISRGIQLSVDVDPIDML